MKNSIWIALLFLLAACSKEALLDERKNFTDTVWKSSDTAKFVLDAKTVDGPVNISVLLRTNIDYAYANMFLFMNTLYPNGFFTIDTLQFILADPSGKWLGNRIGNTIEFEVLISKDKILNEQGLYEFSMIHGMQNKELQDIVDIGLRIEKAE